MRPQAHTTATRPVVVNTFNLARPGTGRPCLLDMPEVVTLFHEFGHALHALLSDVRYPAHSAPGVPRDFSEAPAQVHETWAFDERLLEHYARHHRTGQPLPPDWIKQVSERHSTGGVHLLVEILGAAAVDWSWHTLPDRPDDQDGNADWDAARIEARGAARWGLDTVTSPTSPGPSPSSRTCGPNSPPRSAPAPGWSSPTPPSSTPRSPRRS
ncbi:M3 family metallopeptidase [Streptomyces sp. NPDC058642]|uniref:M3 family metallopeptidase n=1 Tax=Streptomyces sp. NPDC058642 TaxID=3346572 RepID=UPI00365D1CD1